MSDHKDSLDATNLPYRGEVWRLGQDEEAAQQFAAIGPLEQEPNRTYESSVSVALSLSFILTGAGAKFKGNAAMQRTTTPVPRRASRPATTDDLDDDQQQLGAMPRSVIRWRPIHQATAGKDVTAKTPTAPQPTATRTTEQLAPKTPHRLSPMWLFALPALLAILLVTALPGLERQWHGGDHNTQEWTINGDGFTTWVNNGQVNILVMPHGDASKAQLLPSRVVGYHVDSIAVELMGQGSGVLVFVNGTNVGELVPNGQGGYTWK